jgi:hypothetical protein
VQLPLNAQVDITSDEIVDEVKSYEVECTYRQQYTVSSSFPIKKRKYVYEAKRAGENKQVRSNLICIVRSGISCKSDGMVRTAVIPLSGSRSGERKYTA